MPARIARLLEVNLLLLEVADIAALAKIAHARKAVLLIDNTFASPILCRPLELGADLVMESLTKTMNGHSDVVLGLLCGREAVFERVPTVISAWGLSSSPFDCWLAERGLHTFELRFERAQSNAKALADHLRGLAGVKRVLYPGEDDHPDRDLARDLLQGGFSHMVSFELAADRAGVNRFLRAASNIAFAPTLGDVATTLSHPASSSHRGLSEAGRLALGISEGFIRVSVGIEDIELLKREITAAVAAV